MAGSSIFDYVHVKDHGELAEHLGMHIVPGSCSSPPGSGSDDGSSPATPRPSSPSERGYMMVRGADKVVNKSFSLRMKSTLTKRGVHVKTSGYRVVHILGTLRPQSAYSQSRTGTMAAGGAPGTEETPLLGLVGLAIALPPPTITELRLELDTFITRLSPDFKVVYCEPIVSDLMDLVVEDVADRLLYDLCHPEDLEILRRAHAGIMIKGQALTDYYRLMNRHGGYVWVQTCATTLLNNKNSEDQSILAINYVVSSIEGKSCHMDLWQMTGDVTSSMSSSSNSRCREEKLKDLKANLSQGTKSTVSSMATTAHSPTSMASSMSPSLGSSNREEHGYQTDVDPGYAVDLSPKTCSQSLKDETEEQPSEKAQSSHGDNSKNKRRKMENPRKRKRSSSDALDPRHEKDTALNLTSTLSPSIAKESKDLTKDTNNKKEQSSSCKTTGSADLSSSSSSSNLINSDRVTSSAPEDLSMKKAVDRSTLDRNVIQHSAGVFRDTMPALQQSKAASLIGCGLEANKQSSSPVSITVNSVQDLEAAMNRHLPVPIATSASLPVFTRSEGGSSYEGMTSALGGGNKLFSSPGNAPTSHTNASWLPSSRVSGADVLTASNFLRSLYANRESVIKTNARPQGPFSGPEPPTSLLTPPETEPGVYKDYYMYGKQDFQMHRESNIDGREHLHKDMNHKDQFSLIPYKDHPLQTAYIDHISSNMYKEHFTSPYKDIPAFTIPSLMSPAGRKHQHHHQHHHQSFSSLPHHFPVPLTPGVPDACSITPPSSNSPDASSKNPQQPQQYDVIPGYTAGSDLSAACDLSQKHAMNNSLLPAPSSPGVGTDFQVSRHHKDSFYHVGSNGADLAKGNYYGVPTPGVGSPMYMDLPPTPSVAGHYETYNRPVLPWY